MEKKASSKPYIFLFVLGIAVLLGLDQLTKYLAVTFLKGKEDVMIIRGVVKLEYLENRGASFGMLQNKQWFFWILTVLFLLAAFWFIRKVPKTRRFLPLTITICVLISGAIGNFIDRIVNHYVIDFIYFYTINFAIFNVADIYITLSVIVLICLVLFKYKEADYSVFKNPKKIKEDSESK